MSGLELSRHCDEQKNIRTRTYECASLPSYGRGLEVEDGRLKRRINTLSRRLWSELTAEVAANDACQVVDERKNEGSAHPSPIVRKLFTDSGAFGDSADLAAWGSAQRISAEVCRG